jgi:putative glutamine amidotransferase
MSFLSKTLKALFAGKRSYTGSEVTIRIAIPEPTSLDPDYNARSLPSYVNALRESGAIPEVIPANERPEAVTRLLAATSGVLLPGSRYDIDPEIYGARRIPECGPSDPGRVAVDELLLQDAFNLHKPILAICYGAQALNVWQNGTLIQDLATEVKTPVNHQPGRHVQEAHPARISPSSRLASLLPQGGPREPQVNSSHHQAIRSAGDHLRIAATSPADGVIEAVELDAADHFVLAVQWHPERTYPASAFSRAIFGEFVREATAWAPRRIEESVGR